MQKNGQTDETHEGLYWSPDTPHLMMTPRCSLSPKGTQGLAPDEAGLHIVPAVGDWEPPVLGEVQ